MNIRNDTGPTILRKENGEAKLGGERLDHATLSDVPTAVDRRRADEYEAVGEEEA